MKTFPALVLLCCLPMALHADEKDDLSHAWQVQTNALGALLQAYLPGYALRPATEQPGTGIARPVRTIGAFILPDLQLVDADGRVVSGATEASQRGYACINDLLRKRQVAVTNAATALELARFVVDLASGGGQILRNDSHWQRTAEKVGTSWLVHTEYVGPPANVLLAPNYAVDTDADGCFVQVREDGMRLPLSSQPPKRASPNTASPGTALPRRP